MQLWLLHFSLRYIFVRDVTDSPNESHSIALTTSPELRMERSHVHDDVIMALHELMLR